MVGKTQQTLTRAPAPSEVPSQPPTDVIQMLARPSMHPVQFGEPNLAVCQGAVVDSESNDLQCGKRAAHREIKMWTLISYSTASTDQKPTYHKLCGSASPRLFVHQQLCRILMLQWAPRIYPRKCDPDPDCSVVLIFCIPHTYQMMHKINTGIQWDRKRSSSSSR